MRIDNTARKVEPVYKPRQLCKHEWQFFGIHTRKNGRHYKTYICELCGHSKAERAKL